MKLQFYVKGHRKEWWEKQTDEFKEQIANIKGTSDPLVPRPDQWHTIPAGKETRSQIFRA